MCAYIGGTRWRIAVESAKVGNVTVANWSGRQSDPRVGVSGGGCSGADDDDDSPCMPYGALQPDERRLGCGARTRRRRAGCGALFSVSHSQITVVYKSAAWTGRRVAASASAAVKPCSAALFLGLRRR
jgi:hypothetical protein